MAAAENTVNLPSSNCSTTETHLSRRVWRVLQFPPWLQAWLEFSAYQHGRTGSGR